MTNKIKLAIVVFIIAVFGAVVFKFGYDTADQVTSEKYHQVVEEAVDETARRYEVQLEEQKDDLKEVVMQLKAEVISRLERGESGGVGEDRDSGSILYTHDPSSEYRGVCARIGGIRDIHCDSWGVMQFKLPTVIWYYEKLYGVTLTEKEALMLALDDDRARQLASDMIFEVEGAIWNWSAAYHDEAYYAYQIPFIRSLMAKLDE